MSVEVDERALAKRCARAEGWKPRIDGLGGWNNPDGWFRLTVPTLDECAKERLEWLHERGIRVEKSPHRDEVAISIAYAEAREAEEGSDG